MPPPDLASESVLFVHELPSAPKFVGREAELVDLKEFWRGNQSVVSLIGLGGAGKTALADRFVTWVLENDPPERAMVWSFYDDPDTNAFLERLYRFLSGDETAEVKGSGWFHLLREQLSGSRRVLIVLDGLERVQRPSTDASGIFGEIEDPLLRGLLVRLATVGGGSKAVITSRFPVATIEPHLGKGYRIVSVEQLPPESVAEIFRSRGIDIDAEQASDLLHRFGSHALTIDLLAGALSFFYDGQLNRLSETPPEGPSERLTFVLGLYEKHLSHLELDLIRRLCVFRFGVDSKTLFRIFSQAESPTISGMLADLEEGQLLECLDRLVLYHLVYRESSDRYTVHPAVRDHFYRLFRDPAHVHDAIADHFSSLTARPGIGLPKDKEALDLLEELVYHAIRAHAVDKAAEVYTHRLGGNDHLNGTLGEYARCYRILSAFADCPDPSGMYHCERAFGNFGEALKWRPQNRYIMLIQGRLAELTGDASDSTRSLARALRGDSGATIPDRSSDFPISSALAHLLRGDVDAAKRAAETELAVSLYEDDRIRNLLVLAEVCRQEQRRSRAHELIEAASSWILQSTSQEHLVYLHYVRCQLAIDEGARDAARFALEEGLTLAEESQFLVFTVLFRLAKCRLAAQDGDLSTVRAEAEAVQRISKEDTFGFAYGMSESAQYLKA